MGGLTWLAVALGAGAGAPTRFFVDRYFLAHTTGNIPFGTFTVNMIGSLILGLLTGITFTVADGTTGSWALITAFVGTGFCGALTTFSGFCSQVLELSRGQLPWPGAVYGLGSVTLGFAAATIGYLVGTAIG